MPSPPRAPDLREPPRAAWTAPLHSRRVGLSVGAVTLVALIVAVIVGSLETDRAAEQAQRAVEINTAYQGAATAVAAEQLLERQYRIRPEPATAAAQLLAGQQVRTDLAAVRLLGGSSDRLLVTAVLAEHDAYLRGVTKLFAAVDRHASAAAIQAIASGEVDPVSEAIQGQVSAAAASHQSLAEQQVTAMRATGRLFLAFDIAVLVAATALIAAAGLTLSRSQRRLGAQSELNHHQALHDRLTGLPNRDLFQDRTDHALRAARRSGRQLAVMIVDLNRFREVNDTLGHHYGDLLLVQVAHRFSANLRAGDSVARLGGDEFALLLNDTSPVEAVGVARRLTETLQEPFLVKDISLDVDASIGIALAGPDSDVETAMRHADVAMYEAKGQHIPYATYELTRDDNTLARLALLGELHRAIRDGELVLHYQPKVSASTGDLHSVEALVRWQHPVRGLLPPAAFVPIAEGTAVIHPLTGEILRQVLVRARSWLDRGWRIPVAVNISARSLLDLSFPSQVQHQLDAVGVPAGLLILELTESTIMTDPECALVVLQALDAMGVVLSIDDFGTGYSSMAYLKDLPVRELKIDQSFVLGMGEDRSDAVLVRSAVDLGHNLGLHVVGEGVEDAGSQDALLAMGCDLLQGYHICRPVPSTEFERWVRSREPNAATVAGAAGETGSDGRRPPTGVGPETG